ncbi:hypothetical protein CANINC_001894 [Pichia inconspicua]|uniref:PH domain-containing protein n=1 Tax=Pichia inconspicua TaxID=52247 RepID=A0A4T0X2J7_9ASCO|nr:hypothetical protein CANINC_001894 [[Candida] inconspicua]
MTEPIDIEKAPAASEACTKTDLLSYTFPDSTDILAQRYDKCIKLVKTIEEFAEGYSAVAESSLKQYESLNKNLATDVPIYESTSGDAKATVPGSNAVISPPPTAQVNGEEIVSSSNSPDLNMFVASIRGHISDSYKKSYELHLKIEEQVVPDLKRLLEETSKRQKAYLSDSKSQRKQLDKVRDSVAKISAELDQSVQEFNRGVHSSNKNDYKKDPYYIKKHLLDGATQQIQAENSRIEFLANCEMQLKAFESKSMGELRRIFDLLSQNIVSSYTGTTDQVQSLNTIFKSIDGNNEWTAFVQQNSSNMITAATVNEKMETLSISSADNANSYKRNIEDVVFSNIDHVSTKPLIEGILALQSTILGISRNYTNQYIVISPSGYLFCLKSEKLVESSPNFVLYLPDCEVRTIGSIGKHGEFKFSLRGKDVSTLSLKPKKKHVFKASSEQEYRKWVAVITKAAGTVQAGAVSDISDGE